MILVWTGRKTLARAQISDLIMAQMTHASVNDGNGISKTDKDYTGWRIIKKRRILWNNFIQSGLICYAKELSLALQSFLNDELVLPISISRVDKWYALVWFHVCPVAWLKITKLCPCLSNFPGFFAVFKVWLFFENGETNFTPKQSSRMF